MRRKMYFANLAVFCIIIAANFNFHTAKTAKNETVSHGAFKRHSVTGRKGVHEPVSPKNASNITALRRIYRKLHNREKRSTRQRSGKTIRHPPHTNYHETSDDGLQENEQESSFPEWIQKIIDSFHLSTPAPDSDARMSWYTVGKDKKPFVADVDVCILDQCYNQGTCYSDPISPFGFRCKCPPGIVGDRCQIILQTCDLEPCQNDGTCVPKHVDSVHRFVCICNPLFTGELCEDYLFATKPVVETVSDFFEDDEERRNMRTKNLIAVCITGFVLVVLFVIAFVFYQFCKCRSPPPNPPRRYKPPAPPPPPPLPSPDKDSPKKVQKPKREFRRQELYCPVATQICRKFQACCDFFLERRPEERQQPVKKLTVVKKESSCGLLGATFSEQRFGTKPRLVSSNPTIHKEWLYPGAGKNARQSASQPNVRTQKHKPVIQDDWLIPRGMARVKASKRPISETNLVPTTYMIEAVQNPESKPMDFTFEMWNRGNEQVNMQMSPRQDNETDITAENEQKTTEISPNKERVLERETFSLLDP